VWASKVGWRPAGPRAPPAGEAVAMVRERARYDLVITSTYLGDMPAAALARQLREAGLDAPVVALAYDMREVAEMSAGGGAAPIDRGFLWEGGGPAGPGGRQVGERPRQRRRRHGR